MDADTLRLVLIIAGGLVLVGLYLWERRRARPNEDEPYEGESYEDGPYQGEDLGSDEDKLEPRLGVWNGEEGAKRGSDAARDDNRERREPAHEPEQPEFDLEPPASAPGEIAPEEPESPLILLLHITPVEGSLEGEAIVQAARQCGIEPGEMDVFHRLADPEHRRNPLFTVANMVKPGTFPFGNMAEFESPGLTLFSQAEGASDDPARLEEMLAVAHCLADLLNGEVLDGTRARLTPEAEQRLRDRVLELVTWRLSDPDRE